MVSIVIVIVIIVVVEQVVPPVVFLARHLLFGDLGTDHLAPAHNFLGFVGAGRAVLDGVIILAQVNNLLVLDGRTLAIACFLARRQDHNGQGENKYQKSFHFQKLFHRKITLFFAFMKKKRKKS